MKLRTALFGAALALVAGGALVATAEPEFSELDLTSLQAQAKDYRHRSDVLRNMIGLRERKIGDIQKQSDALMRQAQADAQARAQAAANAQSSASQDNALLGIMGQIMPGGSSAMGGILKNGMSSLGSAEVDAANKQAQLASAQGAAEIGGAQQGAENLRAQADAYQGEKKKLVYKAHQYEQLADAKDLLTAGEILRLRAGEQARALEDSDKTVEAERRYVESMTVW
jgi:hypothetical protein